MVCCVYSPMIPHIDMHFVPSLSAHARECEFGLYMLVIMSDIRSFIIDNHIIAPRVPETPSANESNEEPQQPIAESSSTAIPFISERLLTPPPLPASLSPPAGLGPSSSAISLSFLLNVDDNSTSIEPDFLPDTEMRDAIDMQI